MTPVCHGTYDAETLIERGCAFCKDFDSCVKKTVDEKVAKAREWRHRHDPAR